MNTASNSSFCLISMLLLMGSAQAAAETTDATLSEVVGTVLVNQGKVYQPAQSGMKLPLNARVLTKDGASAIVASKQGCATRLGANSLFVVNQADPCHGGPAAQKVDPVAVASPASAGGSAGTAASGNPGGLSTNTLVLIGAGTAAVVAGGVVGGLAASGGLESSSNNFDSAAASKAASDAVIANGGTAKAALAAGVAASQGGSPVAVSNAVLAAGGTPSQAFGAASAFSNVAAGGVPCISGTQPLCAG
jgi:hypothetical protein